MNLFISPPARIRVAPQLTIPIKTWVKDTGPVTEAEGTLIGCIRRDWQDLWSMNWSGDGLVGLG